MEIETPVCRALLAAVLLVTATAATGTGNDNAVSDAEVVLRAVPDDLLDHERGKANVPTAVLTAMGLEGTVQDNFAQYTVNGKNVITNGAFSNASGLSTAIMNSGNNVLIQNATILLLDVH